MGGTVFKDLPQEENDKRSRMILEHELRAAIRILGYLCEQSGGVLVVPHRVLGVDYRVSVNSSALDDKITLKSRVHDAR
jgi:hypothetical protein